MSGRDPARGVGVCFDMTERDISSSSDRATRAASSGGNGNLGGMFTLLETSTLVPAVATLFLLYGLEAAQAQGTGTRTDSGDIWLFIPHILLIALVVAGLRRFAVILATFLLLGGCVMGLAACLNSLTGNHESDGLGFASVLQLPIFILCFYSARQPFSLTELAKRGPRLALGAVIAALGWFAATGAVARANAPYRARMTAVAAAEGRETARGDARRMVVAIAACLQRVPVTADSQPTFPNALSDLPKAECPVASRPAPPGFVVEYVPGAADSAGRHRSFRLSAHDQPMTDSARTYETDESMIPADWYGMGERRTSTSGTNLMEMVGVTARCIEETRDTLISPAGTVYQPSLAALLRQRRCGGKPNADSSTMLVPASNGYYVVRYTAPSTLRPHDEPGGYTLSLEPEREPSARSTGGGLLSFFIDTAGSVHLTRRARAATADDPAIPDCPPFHERYRMQTAMMCREWVPRQRWGVTSQLPTIGWSRSGSGTVGAGDTLFVIPQYQPLVQSDSIVEAHIQWDTTRADSTIRRRAGRIGEPLGNGVSIRLQHVYPDTGMKQISFWVRTGTGDRYEFRDSVRVLLPRRYR